MFVLKAHGLHGTQQMNPHGPIDVPPIITDLQMWPGVHLVPSFMHFDMYEAILGLYVQLTERTLISVDYTQSTSSRACTMNALPKVSLILFIDVIPCLTYEVQTWCTVDLLNPVFQQIFTYSSYPVNFDSPGVISRSFVSTCFTLRLSASQE